MTGQIPQVTRRPRIPLPPPSAGPPGAGARRSRLVLRRLDPWSVLKFSLLFYFCMLLVGLLVFAVIWLVLVNMGVFETVTRFAVNFNLDLAFPAGTVFKYYILLGLLGVVLWSVATVLLTLLFNLVNDITGGIEVVLAGRVRRPFGARSFLYFRQPLRSIPSRGRGLWCALYPPLRCRCPGSRGVDSDEPDLGGIDLRGYPVPPLGP